MSMVKSQKKLSTPMDRKTLLMTKRKNNLWSKKRKNLASEEQKLQYGKLQNQIRRNTRKARKLIEKEIAKDAKKNPKKFWAYSQRKLKTGTGIPDLLRSDTEETSYTTNDTEKANEFLKTFSSVFTTENISDGMPDFPKQNYTHELKSIDINKNY